MDGNKSVARWDLKLDEPSRFKLLSASGKLTLVKGGAEEVQCPQDLNSRLKGNLQDSRPSVSTGSMSTGSTSVNSTNCKSKIFRKQHVTVVDVC